MNKDDLYQQWKASRCRVEVPPGFEQRVMKAAEAKQKEHSPPVLDQWLVSATSRWAAAATLLMLGVFRLAYIAGHLLTASRIAP